MAAITRTDKGISPSRIPTNCWKKTTIKPQNPYRLVSTAASSQNEELQYRTLICLKVQKYYQKYYTKNLVRNTLSSSGNQETYLEVYFCATQNTFLLPVL